jgi:F-type H+-transporting ATPase subunit b
MSRFSKLFATFALAAAPVLIAAPALAQHGGSPHGGPHGDVTRDVMRDPATPPMLHEPGEPSPHGASGGHEGAAGGHEGGHHGPADINWADFSNKEQPPFAAALINFAILIGIAVTFGKKPVAEALKARRAAVAKEIEEAAKMKAAAQERAQKYQASLDNLEDDLATTKASLVEAGKAEKDRIVKEAEEKALRMRRDADFRVEQETKQLKIDLTREAVEGAVTEAEALLASKLTAEDHTRLANEFLAELSKKPVLATQGGAA